MDHGEKLAREIHAETIRIAEDYEARLNCSAAVHVLAIATMAGEAHVALDRCELDADTKQYATIIVDQVFAKTLRDRGWRVEEPEAYRG